jgi:hypothetical protein
VKISSAITGAVAAVTVSMPPGSVLIPATSVTLEGLEAGQPHGRWSAGQPHGRYATGEAHGRWSASEAHG